MITQFKIWAARRKVYKQTIRELRSLTPEGLRDIGISECMIPEIAVEAAYGGR